MKRPLAVDGVHCVNFTQDEPKRRSLSANYAPGKQAGSIGAGAVTGGLIGRLTSVSGQSTEGSLAGAVMEACLALPKGNTAMMRPADKC